MTTQYTFANLSKRGDFELCGNCISVGVARLYYESGFPLAASAKFAQDNGFGISWLNVADQFLKQGFSQKRIVSEFRDLLHFRPGIVDIEQIERFCSLGYEEQRQMLWEFWESYFIEN